MDGAIVVDKPEGWTSHDAVAKMRRLANTKKIGHLGTLDPLATGVLPLVVGRATRLAQFYTKSSKKYDALLRFGYSTDTYDRDGEPTSPKTEPLLDRTALLELLEEFQGLVMQTPPAVSAKKVAGIPAYKLARRQQPVELKPVEVIVYSIELVECQGTDARIIVHCGSGTYLRSLAHDLGQRLGCGGFVQELRRMESGHFNLSQARTLVQIEELAKEGRIEEALIPAAVLLPEFPNEVVDTVTANHIKQGRDFRVSPFRVRQGTKYVKAIGPEGSLLAIGEARLPNVYHPILVL